MKWTKEAIIQLLRDLRINKLTDHWDIRHCGRCPKEVEVCSGASKICLVFPGVPYVVKWSTGNYNEAMREVEIYQDAIGKNLEKFFPSTEFLVTINDVDFVMQEKIDESAGELELFKKKKYQRISKTALDRIVRKMQKEINKAAPSYSRTLDPTWAKMALVIYGKNTCKTLCEFIIAHSINDLHKHNIGYKKGKPIILDFSGYNR